MRRHAPVIRAIIFANIIVFLWEIATMGPGLLGGNESIGQIIAAGALVPSLVLVQGEWWRIVSSAFLHASLLHIGFNMFSLWVIGNFIEPILGSRRTALLYTVSLLASGLGVIYFGAANTATLGASGAIFGVFGAFFAVGLRSGAEGRALVRANLWILILNLVFTFAVPGISKQAHVAGLLSGFLLTLAIFWPPKPIHADVIDRTTGATLESTLEEGDSSRAR